MQSDFRPGGLLTEERGRVILDLLQCEGKAPAVVILDSVTTALQGAEHLPFDLRATVVTNLPPAAIALVGSGRHRPDTLQRRSARPSSLNVTADNPVLLGDDNVGHLISGPELTAAMGPRPVNPGGVRRVEHRKRSLQRGPCYRRA